MTPTINCCYVNLPTTISAFVVENPDASYTIVLNARHSREKNLKSYMHELNHILNGDFEKDCSADLLELQAHNNLF